ncbi:hypothetical protein [Lysinibacillus sphaericus]
MDGFFYCADTGLTDRKAELTEKAITVLPDRTEKRKHAISVK